MVASRLKTLAIVQNKGGVGKTTLCRLLAEYLTKRKKLRVLAIDLDPQCSLSQRFITMEMNPDVPDGFLPPLHPNFDPRKAKAWTGRSSSADLYATNLGGRIVPYPTKLPGHGDLLRRVEVHMRERAYTLLNSFLSQEHIQGTYDMALIDTSPSKGPLTVSAVRASTHLLIPTIMEPQGIEGLYGMLQLWRTENRLRAEPLMITGILANRVKPRTSLHESLFNNLQQDSVVGQYVIPHYLRDRIAFAESDHPEAEPKSVFDLKARDQARGEAEAVCRYISDKVLST